MPGGISLLFFLHSHLHVFMFVCFKDSAYCIFFIYFTLQHCIGFAIHSLDNLQFSLLLRNDNSNSSSKTKLILGGN